MTLSRFLSDLGGVRRGIVVGQGDRRAKLEAKRQAFARLIVRLPEDAAAGRANVLRKITDNAAFRARESTAP